MPSARKLVPLVYVLLGCAVLGCRSSADASAPQTPGNDTGAALAQPKPATPPFPVKGELDGLMLVWFDASGVHTAQKRSDIPEAQRATVRVESLRVAPDQRLDADHVYVADLRTAKPDGSYPVREATRSWFDAQVDRAQPQLAQADTSGVVIYKASWCGVCRAAASYLRSRHVAFIEKDVEKDPGASEEMLRKAAAKGLTPHGVPVIDFRGEIMLGFDEARVAQLIDRYSKSI